VRIKYSEQYEYEQISNLLGMDKKDGFSIQTTKEVTSFLPSLLVLFRSIINYLVRPACLPSGLYVFASVNFFYLFIYLFLIVF